MNRIALFAALILPFSACVTSTKFKAEQQRAEATETKLEQTQQDLDALKAIQASTTEAGQKIQLDLTSQVKAAGDQLVSLQKAKDEQLASVAVQLASVQKSNKDLQQSLESNKDELTKKVSTLIKEKDALSQKLADAGKETATLRKTKDDELADLQRQLVSAEEARKAREQDLIKAQEDRKALEQAKASELAQVKQSYESLTQGLKSEISAGEITITQLKGKLTVNMVDRILFDSGLAEVRPEGTKVLERIGTILNGVKDKDIRIEGHTDNVPIRGDLKAKYPSNWELSTARATAVARYFQDKAKVEASKLVATGYAEFRPVSPNDTPEHRALNRRIEIVLVPKE
ncbi:MAG: OmpA family protein [Elusimicrobiota bacterium]